MNTNEPQSTNNSKEVPNSTDDSRVSPFERWLVIAGATFVLMCLQLLIGSAHVSQQMNSLNFSIDMNQNSAMETFIYGAVLSGMGLLVSIGTYATIAYGAWAIVRFIAGRPLIDLFTR